MTWQNRCTSFSKDSAPKDKVTSDTVPSYTTPSDAVPSGSVASDAILTDTMPFIHAHDGRPRIPNRSDLTSLYL